MKFQDIAKAFGLTIDQFSEAIGYRKQSLYQGIRKTAKSREAIERLYDLNEEMLRMEIELAHRKYDKRKKAAKEFERRLMNGGEM